MMGWRPLRIGDRDDTLTASEAMVSIYMENLEEENSQR